MENNVETTILTTNHGYEAYFEKKKYSKYVKNRKMSINLNLGGGMGVILPPVGFPLITQKPQKLLTWHFSSLNNILLETFVPNLVFLTFPSLKV